MMNNQSNNQSSCLEAVLSSADGFSVFNYGGYYVRFRAPYSLEQYVDVVRWEDGYLAFMAKFRHNNQQYIDLKPISRKSLYRPRIIH